MTGWTPAAAVARRRIAVVVNARSRRGQLLFDAACDGLKARGFEIAAAMPSSDPRTSARSWRGWLRMAMT